MKKPGAWIALIVALLLAVAAGLGRPVPLTTTRTTQGGLCSEETFARTWRWAPDQFQIGKESNASRQTHASLVTDTWHLGPLTVEQSSQRRQWPAAVEETARKTIAEKDQWGDTAVYRFYPANKSQWLADVTRKAAERGQKSDTRRIVLREDGTLVSYSDKAITSTNTGPPL